METEPVITITLKEYQDLLDSQSLLLCLEGCGVDNWSGYSDAYSMHMEEQEE